ncbi:hypothetical protein PHMEG_00041323 [Phytophthora megakarya]|uniref:PiggyBac transposable element-derived protein 4 C-terminal zinc-ribbon domain-containing protein n=1 Tax=Phytophthora megakarya TaxID=4795 RepID=A0A225UC50_9STRA|nr:hypothetical protein PHMEG_00041323 [Phytophthora megakarya]
MFADMMTSQTTAAPQPADIRPIEEGHKLEMDEEWVKVNSIPKGRQWQCKVCTIRKTVSSKRQVTRFYCPKCSNSSKRKCYQAPNAGYACSVYLCDKVRQDHYPNNNLTCYEI